MPQHFLSLNDFDQKQLSALLDRALELKKLLREGASYTPLKNKTLAMIFNKSSTRTRVSFEVGMRQLGGGAINLTPNETQMGRGEPIKDTARVVSSMVDAVMIRTDSHASLERFAAYSRVPVINGLTDLLHPCQLLADLLTVCELRGELSGLTVAWVGDGNNVCHSWMNAASIFDFELKVATPADYGPNDNILLSNAKNVVLANTPEEAVKGANVVVTDTWASMGQEAEKDARNSAFQDFCVDDSLMKRADKNALFLHCLPAYRGMEVTDEVIEGAQSAVFQAAENRLHAQKALLELLLNGATN